MKAKEAKELLPVIQAFAEGEQIQWFSKQSGKWNDVDSLSFTDKPDHYRIKPKAHYRAFKTADECFDAMSKHYPFGWVKNEAGYRLVTSVDDVCNLKYSVICHVGDGDINEADMLCYYKFADGEPFGVLED